MTAFADSLSVLRSRRFTLFFAAALSSNLGIWMQEVAKPWLLVTVGASPLLIGMGFFASTAPALLLTIFGGRLADVWDRTRVLTVFQTVLMVCPLIIFGLLLTRTIDPWTIVALSLVAGVADALMRPSLYSIVPSLVERAQIGPALALSAVQYNLTRTLGPALAGPLIAGIGAAACFALSALAYLPLVLVAAWVLPKSPAPHPEPGPPEHLAATLRQIAGTPHLQGAMITMFLVTALCGPLMIFSPVLIKEGLGGDVADFAIATAADGIGGLLGAVAILGIEATVDRRRLCCWAAMGYGAVVILAALDPWLTALPVLFVGSGLMLSLGAISANTFVQSTTSDALRGQATSLYMLSVRAGLAVGGLVTGATVSAFGVRDALLINGVVAVVAQLVVARRWLLAPVPAGVSAA